MSGRPGREGAVPEHSSDRFLFSGSVTFLGYYSTACFDASELLVLIDPELQCASGQNVTGTASTTGHGHLAQGGTSLDQSDHSWRKPGYRPCRSYW
ncbi:hypothetical protein XENOCAPTIV_025263 [Xenoophorus captivus]|uniref:Uncharacterized protein n=1 Tax=Xenoophorus captivus TaxID=1517983 RepID=A0ABV0S9R4_9TELE